MNCSQSSCKPPKKWCKNHDKKKKIKFAYNAIGSHLIWIKHRTILVKQISTRIGCVFFLCVVRVFSGIALLRCCCCCCLSVLRSRFDFAIHCSWQCFFSCLARDAVSCSKTLTRNMCAFFSYLFWFGWKWPQDAKRSHYTFW